MNIVYLIGAGASVGTYNPDDEKSKKDIIIPPVSEFANGLFEFAEYINSYDHINVTFGHNNINNRALRKIMYDKIRWLAKCAKDHASIDTFAKKLFLKGEKVDLAYLKLLISEFLYYRHYKYGLDKRYDAFLAALLKKTKG